MELVNERGYHMIGLPIKMDTTRAVFKCKHNETGKEFVIKWINCEESEESDYKQLMREKDICKTLEHQNIIKFVEFFESPLVNGISTYCYQVMELCRSDLSDWFKQNKNRSLDVCHNFINEIISGLSYLHSKNIMQRDLKPQNILISFDGICKLADFGLVKKHITTITKGHTSSVGTELYAAPELRLNQDIESAVKEGKYNLKIDVYSLGIIILEFFTIFNNIRESLTAIQEFKKSGSIPVKFFEKFDRNANAMYFTTLNDLIVKMIKTDPNLRPQLTEVKQCFHDMNEIKDSTDNSKLTDYKRNIIQQLSKKYSVFTKFDSKLIDFSKFVFIYYRNEYLILVNKENEKKVFEIRVNGTFDTLGEKKMIEELSNKTILDIACGFEYSNNVSHVICLTENSQVFAWGNNREGQLGNQTTFDNNAPTIVDNLKDKHIVNISCGAAHTLVLSKFGRVYASGRNTSGQLGLSSDNEFFITPTLIDSFRQNDMKIKAISCGQLHSLALTENGLVYSWGSNKYGQCGDHKDSRENIKSAISVELERDVIIKKISCGPFHSLLLSSDGHVYSFGWNNCGQLGRQSDDNNRRVPTKIETSEKFADIYSNIGQSISIGLSETKKCFVWGLYGNLIAFTPFETLFESINETILAYSNIEITPKAIIL